MEKLETKTDEFYGPKEDESMQIVATVSHEMNVMYTQSCYCIKKGEPSEIYHTSATMPNAYPAEWINLLAWIGFQHHLPYTIFLVK